MNSYRLHMIEKEVPKLKEILKLYNNKTELNTELYTNRLLAICKKLLELSNKYSVSKIDSDYMNVVKTKTGILDYYYQSLRARNITHKILPDRAKDNKVLSNLISLVKDIYDIDATVAYSKILKLIDTLCSNYKEIGINDENMSSFSRIFFGNKDGNVGWITELLINICDKESEERLIAEADKATERVEATMTDDDFGFSTEEIKELLARQESHKRVYMDYSIFGRTPITLN